VTTVHQCPTCGKQLHAGVRFCPDDGTPLAETAAVAAARTPTGHPTQRIELQLPVVVGGRYQLVEALGGGGMAKVYKAVDQTLGREVAVKVIHFELRRDPEFDARFQREARIASQLADPHIVVVHDFGLDPELGPFLVMELLQGMSLRQRLQADGPLPLKAALQLCGQLFLALIHAHGKGIVHRDIKPDNIFLLNQSGVRLHVRVLDFGIARIYRREENNQGQTLTHLGAVLGTPRYMSPEQLAGQPVDARSDLYSAALVIHETLTGQLPYVSSSKLCDLCPEVPPTLQDLLVQCLKPEPNERPANAIDVYLRLQEVGKASGVLMLPPGALDKLVSERQAKQAADASTVTYLAPQGKPPGPRRRWMVAGALLSLLAFLGVAGAFAARHWWTGTTATDRESLLGLHIGDEAESLRPYWGKAFVNGTEVWKDDDSRPRFMGNVLKARDLGVAGAGAKVTARLSADEKLWVALRPDPEQDSHWLVQAIVLRSPREGTTSRGLRMGAGVADLFRLYPETPTEVIQKELPRTSGKGDRATHIEVRRFDQLGIGFEVREGHVTAITLYPAVTPP
jgi:tRNA A-37 threonylcarbamoyl transferase component Bud32